MFFEDISGVNLMFTSDFEVYLIDADSLVFYNETRFAYFLPVLTYVQAMHLVPVRYSYASTSYKTFHILQFQSMACNIVDDCLIDCLAIDCGTD